MTCSSSVTHTSTAAMISSCGTTWHHHGSGASWCVCADCCCIIPPFALRYASTECTLYILHVRFDRRLPMHRTSRHLPYLHRMHTRYWQRYQGIPLCVAQTCLVLDPHHHNLQQTKDQASARSPFQERYAGLPTHT